VRRRGRRRSQGAPSSGRSPCPSSSRSSSCSSCSRRWHRKCAT
jgi:hypothetical protein